MPTSVPPSPAVLDEVAEPERRRFHRRDLALFIAPVVLAGLGVWGLGRGDAYGYDEAASRWAATLPLRDLFRLLSHVDAVHGLYYLALHAWVVFGDGPVLLRLPSLLASVAAAGVVTALGRRLADSTWVGLIAGLLYAISPFVTFYAQTARSFAIVSLVVALATLVLVWALDNEGAHTSRAALLRYWVGYAVLIALAGWLNELSLFVLGAHAVTVAVTKDRRACLHWLIAAALATVAVIPLVIISLGEASVVATDRLSLHRVYWLSAHLFGPSRPVMLATIGCATAALLPGRNTRRARVLSVALPLMVVPAALLAVEAAIGQPLFGARFLLYTEVGAALLVGCGALRIGQLLLASRPRAVTWAPAAGVAVILFALIAQIPYAEHIRTPQSRLHDFGAPAAYIDAHERPGDGVLFFNSFFRMVELGYPQDFHDVRDIVIAQTPLATGTFHGVNLPFALAEPQILTCQRIWAIGLPANVRPIGSSDMRELSLLRLDYQPIGFRAFQGVDLTLWVRRTDVALPPVSKPA